KQNLEHLGLLAGGIAHDFNNLLVGVLGNADLALNKSSADSPLRPALRAIASSAQRMAEHTRELLDYAGHTATKLSLVQLDHVLDEAMNLTRPILPPAVALDLERRSTRPVWVLGDAGQLTRMLVNLIRSAADAFEEKSGSVSVSIDRSGECAEVSIRDTGSGMEEPALARMFDPFYSSKRAGRGLGLASIPGIVKRHEGSISVESAPRSGTRVVIRIPSREPASSKTPSYSPERRWTGRALVVDDEAPVRSVASRMLTALGFDVIEAEDGATAVELVRRDLERCVFVLLDATMPGLNGAQTLEKLRAIRPQLPVLLCSGYSRADFTQLLEGQPHTAFLTKPFRLEQLATALESVLPSGGRGSADSI
ncbi:MAG: response regulator, partial [Polyangiaceae bacterium]|nr:response regulator [Polyangiaceae bacterium]